MNLQLTFIFKQKTSEPDSRHKSWKQETHLEISLNRRMLVHFYLDKELKNKISYFSILQITSKFLGVECELYLRDIPQVCAYLKQKYHIYYIKIYTNIFSSYKLIYHSWENIQEMTLHNRHTNEIYTRANNKMIYM